MNKKVVVLGAGIAGLGAAEKLKENNVECVVYEKKDTYGGLCDSFFIQGFTFDYFGHVSFDKNTREWLEDRTEHYTYEPESLNYDNGRWLRHPVINNLYGLSKEEIDIIISDFKHRDKNANVKNYGGWIKSIYGNEYAYRFPYRYTRKYWTVEPEKLRIEWAKGRLYEPSINEVINGSVRCNTPGVHYSKEIHYPIKGGFKAFLKPMTEGIEIQYNKFVSSIDADSKKICFSDGSTEKYDKLISTIPLPTLCNCIKDAPYKVKTAAGNLDYTTGVAVSIGLNISNVSPSLWYYIYDEDIEASRIYSPEWKSKNNVPKGCSAIQAEIYFSKYKPMKESLSKIKAQCIKSLLKLGLFEESNILFSDIRVKEYANIMFTNDIYKNRDIIHEYLNSIGIVYAGRFGEWDYLWTGQSLMSGRKAAERVINELKYE